jgi:hypothetical protein
MTDDELLSLPPGVVLRILLNCLDEDTVGEIRRQPMPEIPRAAKYDAAIYVSGGIKWASECDLENLRYFRNRSAASAASGGEWADKDLKRVANLEKWIAWRSFFPDAIWSGERNNEATVAAPPSAKPRVYPRTGGAARKPPPQQEAPAEDYYGTGSGNGAASEDAAGYDDVPF